MKQAWRIRDLIDLEYFLHEDDGADDMALVRRDREIYLRKVVPALEEDGSALDSDRKTILRLWLDACRRRVKALPGRKALLPGRLFVDLFSLLLIGFMVLGLITGGGMAVAFLEYRGAEPVNVSTYFGIFVLLQLVLVFVLMLLSLLRQWIPSLQRMSLLRPLLGVLMGGMIRRVIAHARDTFSAGQQNRLAALTGILKGRRRIYGSVFYWPVFILAQVMGLGFNLGVLACSLLRIVSLDMAFGWQSTIQFSAQAVYGFVKAIALPWSWVVPPSMAHPTYAQIQGSRMVLKDGIYHLATPDLVSWWPFLLLAVLCYGLLPRAILFIVGIVAQKMAMNKVALNHAACNRVMRRLRTPLLETDGPVGAQEDTARAPDASAAQMPRDTATILPQGHEAIVLVPDEIPVPPTGTLDALLQGNLQLKMKQNIEITGDFEVDMPVLSALTDPRQLKDASPVVVIQEAWQPPIAETLWYLKKIRELAGPQVPIHIFLVGKSASENRFTDAVPSDWQIWQQAIQTLGDPFIEVNGVRDL